MRFLSKKNSEFVTKIAALFFPSLENISVTLETEKMNNEYIHWDTNENAM